jgi:hypothetical protein
MEIYPGHENIVEAITKSWSNRERKTIIGEIQGRPVARIIMGHIFKRQSRIAHITQKIVITKQSYAGFNKEST